MNQQAVRHSHGIQQDAKHVSAKRGFSRVGKSARSSALALACGAVALLASGCGNAGSAQPGGAGLTLATFSDTEIVGSYSDSVTTLEFTSHETAPGVVVAEVGSGDASITINVDYNEGVVDTAGSEATFTPEAVEALAALESELLAVLSTEEDAPRVEAALGSLASMASDADAGERFPSVRGVSDRGWVTISCSNVCRTLYRSCGGSYVKQTGISSPNCKGRCGAGCGDARSSGKNVWSMDCAEHDYHLGPFADCADDYTFANKTSCTYSPAEYCATNCSCTTGPGC